MQSLNEQKLGPPNLPRRSALALAAVLGAILTVLLGVVNPVWAAGSIIDIKPANAGSFVPITQVVLDDNGTIVTQNTESATNSWVNRGTPVNLVSVTVNDGGNPVVLNQFNLSGGTVKLIGLDNPAYDPGDIANGGLGVLQSDGTRVLLRNGREAFRQAAEGTLTNTNLNNYIHYDGITNPPANIPDYDIQFPAPWSESDYILVMERWGNTYFTLTPLDATGTPIANANVLRFGFPTGTQFTLYDWNTGYANSVYQTQQAYAFTVAKASKFFENTTVPPQDRYVYGFRIDNDGEADVKFFGLGVRNIDIQKTPDLQTVLTGTDVQFTITVTNTGSVVLNNVTVTDAFAPNCNANLGTMQPGASATYTCILEDVDKSFTNVAIAEGTPVSGPKVYASDDAKVEVIVKPAISALKTDPAGEPIANWEFCLYEATQNPLAAGDQVGCTPTNDVGEAGFANLALGEYLLCEVMQTGWVALQPALPDLTFVDGEKNLVCQLVNVTTVHGMPGPDTATAVFAGTGGGVGLNRYTVDFAGVTNNTWTYTVTGEIAQNALSHWQLDLGVCWDNVVANSITWQDPGSFGFNVGSIDDANPIIKWDDMADFDQGVYGVFAFTLDDDYPAAGALSATFKAGTNQGTTLIVGPDCSPTPEPIEFSNAKPAIDIRKNAEGADSQTVVSGQSATWTIQVQNTGNVTLTEVAVTDAQAPNCANPAIGTLVPGQVFSYTCALANVTQGLVNVAAVSGKPPVGPNVTDEDPSEVIVITPAIDIRKNAEGADSQTVVSGQSATWTIQVQNTGNVTLTEVAVTDAQAPNCANAAIGTLVPGQVFSYTCALANVTQGLVNVAVVSGKPPVGPNVTDEDPSEVIVIQPELASLGNRVWNDVNNNGIQDDGESGVAGVTVNLLDSGNNVLATTTTDASGLYTFTNLAPGSYVVEFVKPAGTLFSPQFQGGDPAKDSNANPTTGKSDLVTLVAGQFDETIDAGLFTPSVEPELASLGDRVWLDANQNGVQDDGESGVAGVLVTLYRENGEEVATDTTDGAGNYLFTNLPPGSYYVHFARPQGYVFTRYNVGDPAQDSNAQVPTLALQVTTPLAEVALGGVLSYTLTYANAAGQPTATGVVLSATVPAGTTFLPGASTAGWVCADDSTAAGTPCTLTVAEVTAGTQAQVLFVVQLGTDDAQVPDAINLAVTIDQATPGRTEVVTLAAGEQNLTIDAGIYPQAMTVTETPRRPGPTNLDPGAQPLGRNKIYLPAVQN